MRFALGRLLFLTIFVSQYGEASIEQFGQFLNNGQGEFQLHIKDIQEFWKNDIPAHEISRGLDAEEFLLAHHGRLLLQGAFNSRKLFSHQSPVVKFMPEVLLRAAKLGLELGLGFGLESLIADKLWTSHSFLFRIEEGVVFFEDIKIRFNGDEEKRLDVYSFILKWIRGIEGSPRSQDMKLILHEFYQDRPHLAFLHAHYDSENKVFVFEFKR